MRRGSGSMQRRGDMRGRLAKMQGGTSSLLFCSSSVSRRLLSRRGVCSRAMGFLSVERCAERTRDARLVVHALYLRVKSPTRALMAVTVDNDVANERLFWFRRPWSTKKKRFDAWVSRPICAAKCALVKQKTLLS